MRQIGDKWADWNLTAKPHSGQSAVAQHPPHHALRIGRVAAKRWGNLALLVFAHGSLHAAPPDQFGVATFFSCQRGRPGGRGFECAARCRIMSEEVTSFIFRSGPLTLTHSCCGDAE
jgi:hypothetical protein